MGTAPNSTGFSVGPLLTTTKGQQSLLNNWIRKILANSQVGRDGDGNGVQGSEDLGDTKSVLPVPFLRLHIVCARICIVSCGRCMIIETILCPSSALPCRDPRDLVVNSTTSLREP
jgi:hypothetical protein